MDFESKLDIVYQLIDDQINQKLVIPKPDIEVTSTNTFWHNVKSFLKIINRPPDHFINFLSSELGVNVNKKTNSLSKGLIIMGKHRQNKFISLVNKYIKYYVQCKFCHSSDTTIKKNNDIRKYELNCNQCQSNYSV